MPSREKLPTKTLQLLKTARIVNALPQHTSAPCLPSRSGQHLGIKLAAYGEVEVLQVAEHRADTAEEGGAEHETSRWGNENEGDEENENARFDEIGE